MSVMTAVGACGAGVAAWTFLEYALHNWAFHGAKGRNMGSREHLAHHARPDYFAPWSTKLAAVVPAVSVLGALVAVPTSVATGAGFGLGVGLGWAAYEALHRLAHVAAPRTAYGRWVRRNHLYHHFGSPRTNHGVTSPLWDLVFGTYVPVAQVRVPRKHAAKFPWMLDGDAVAPAFAQDYTVV